MHRLLSPPNRVSSFRWLVATGLLLSLVAGCEQIGPPAAGTSGGSGFPRRAIKVIVPFAAGGGSDTFGRIVQNAIEDNHLLSQKLVIINVPGAGGTIGSRRVKNAVPDGYTILLLHEGILTAKYSGQSPFGPEAFQPIIGTGSAPQVIAVSEDSPFQNLQSLMNAAKARPDEIVYAANIGAPSHFAGLMLEEQLPGATFRYTQTGGGAKRLESILGNHVDVSSFSLAEYDSFRPAGLRALAILSRDRHPDFADLETAGQQGFDVFSENTQYWWAPRGTPDDRVKVVAETIQQAMQLPVVRERLRQLKIDPVTMRGDSLTDDLRSREAAVSAVSTRELTSLPDFPLIVLVITVVLGMICWRTSQRPANRPSSTLPGPPLPMMVAAVAVIVAYPLALQFAEVPFAAATSAFIFLLGGLIAINTDAVKQSGLSRVWPVLAAIAIVLAVSVDYVFRNILVVDLP